jgi:hypothetical protein
MFSIFKEPFNSNEIVRVSSAEQSSRQPSHLLIFVRLKLHVHHVSRYIERRALNLLLREGGDRE